MDRKINAFNSETLLPEPIITLIREGDLYNKEMVNYFGKHYRKRLKDCGIIGKAILISLISLISIIIGFSIDLLLKNLNSIYLIVFLTFLILLPVIASLFYLMKKQFGISEFNIKNYYSLISFILILFSVVFVVFQLMIPFIFGLYFIPLSLLLICYITQTRILAPGILYLYLSFILLRDLYETNYWSPRLIEDFRGAFKKWDDWIAKIQGLRVENLKILEKIIFQDLHLHPIPFRERIKMTLKRDLFSLLTEKNWRVKSNISSVSNKILSLLDRNLTLDLVPDSLWTKIKKETESLVPIFVLISCIIAIASFTINILRI